MWRKNNPKKTKEYAKRSALKRREQNLIYKHKWYLEHKDVEKEKARQRFLRNPEEMRKKWREKNRNYRSKHPRQKEKQTPRRKFNKYRNDAKRRGYEFLLSFEEFFSLRTNTICYYCSSSEKIGIDRVNNKMGYLKENCVPCCWDCNRTKRILSKETFIKICIAVAKNFNEQRI